MRKPEALKQKGSAANEIQKLTSGRMIRVKEMPITRVCRHFFRQAAIGIMVECMP